MSKLLYIQASPRGGRSHPIAVADAFVESYRQHNPDDEVITLDISRASLPPLRAWRSRQSTRSSTAKNIPGRNWMHGRRLRRGAKIGIS